jgi:hypothetical protein
MPFIDPNDPREFEWRRNATKAWGVALYPLGEYNIVDFLATFKNNSDEQRQQLLGMQLQMMLVALMLYLFGDNLIISSRMVITRPRTIFSWCCLIPSAAGFVVGVIIAFGFLGLAFNCRIMVWSIGFGMSIGMVCNSLILLRKVYLVLYQQRWIVYIGVPLIFPQMVYAFLVVYNMYMTLEPRAGCVIYYFPIIPYYWISVIVPLNVLFSIGFSYIAFQQYRLFGSDAWKRLARDGIQTMCLAIFCNITCCILMLKHLSGPLSDVFYAVDWFVYAV